MRYGVVRVEDALAVVRARAEGRHAVRGGGPREPREAARGERVAQREVHVRLTRARGGRVALGDGVGDERAHGNAHKVHRAGLVGPPAELGAEARAEAQRVVRRTKFVALPRAPVVLDHLTATGRPQCGRNTSSVRVWAAGARQHDDQIARCRCSPGRQQRRRSLGWWDEWWCSGVGLENAKSHGRHQQRFPQPAGTAEETASTT